MRKPYSVLQNPSQIEKTEYDLKSPRFVEAYKRLGLEEKELSLRKKKEFGDRKREKEVVELRYKHHLSRLMDLLN
jgi:hypothetical protein